MADILHGGRGDQTTKAEVRAGEYAKGKKVEMEHTTSTDLASEIARDHLKEIPDYYTRLGKMEQGATKKADDEAGGKAPSKKDRMAIEHFLKSHPNLKDEDYHEFLESKGINVPKGEAAAYALVRKCASSELKDLILSQLHGDSDLRERTEKSLLRKKVAGGAGIGSLGSPKARLSASRSASKLDYSQPGTSIAQQAKPNGPGWGGAVPGATKTGALIEKFAALDPVALQRQIDAFK